MSLNPKREESMVDNDMLAEKSPLAEEVEVKMLKKGGDAFDVSVATGLTREVLA